jgi:hypothetical protein
VSDTTNLPEMDNSMGVKLKWNNNTVVAFDCDGSTPTNTSTPSTQMSASQVSYNPSTSSQVFNDSIDVSRVEEQLIAGLKMRDYFHGEESWSLTNIENIIVTTHSILTDKFEDPYDKKHNKVSVFEYSSFPVNISCFTESNFLFTRVVYAGKEENPRWSGKAYAKLRRSRTVHREHVKNAHVVVHV